MLRDSSFSLFRKKKFTESQNKQALGIRLIERKISFMRLSKHLIRILVLFAGFAYSVEATLPEMTAIVIENSGEESEANEKTESLVPAQTEAKQIRENSRTKVNRPSGARFFSAHSCRQFFVKPSRIILHRKLLI